MHLYSSTDLINQICLEPGNSCTARVQYVLSQRFPAKDLVLGIPAYARCFAGVTKLGDNFHGAA